MKLTRVVLSVMWLAVWLLGSGCQTEQLATPQRPCSLDELRPGDMVTVTFSDIPQPGIPEQKVRVKEDGTLSLPYNVTVAAGGKKFGMVEKEIVTNYVPRLFVQLTVSVKTEERWYSVGGEVKLTGRQAYLGPTTVLRAIQSCGDFTDFANRTKVSIHRASGQLEIINCKKAIKNPRFDVPICPGDAIIVPRRMM
jgi:protein involved in polysaccharide export with SLBB domain